MNRRRASLIPLLVVGGSMLLGGFFLQEGVSREENVYLQVRLFQEVVDRISNQFVDPVAEEEIYREAIEGLLDRLGDPNSSFIPASDYEEFTIQATEGRYGGVGLEVIERNGWVTVVAPIPGTPGARAGIRAGDWFVEIDGASAAEISVDEAVQLLRGPEGSEVEVRMGRPGVEEPIPFTLERARIQLNSVPFALTLADGVGYLPLQAFRETAEAEVRRAIDSLRTEGARSLILDLRGNPGGLLTDGVGISDLFLDREDRIVEIRGRARGQNETFTARSEDAYPDLPLVVLVDDRSASASEIVAGALQDHDRALVVGVPTFGKGSVQTIFQLTGQNALRLTTARWYTPVGRSVDRLAAGEEAGQGTEQLGEGPAAGATAPVVSGALALDGSVVRTELDDARPEFESMGGRTLHGGGGITPDLIVLPDTLTTLESRAVRALFRRAGQFTTTLFNVAVEWLAENPDPAPNFTLSDAALERLHGALSEAGVMGPAAAGLGLTEAELLDQADRFLRYHLEQEIALRAFGEAGAFRHTARHDRQLQRALDLLRETDGPSELLLQGAG